MGISTMISLSSLDHDAVVNLGQTRKLRTVGDDETHHVAASRADDVAYKGKHHPRRQCSGGFPWYRLDRLESCVRHRDWMSSSANPYGRRFTASTTGL
jgi:hypothetical protein